MEEHRWQNLFENEIQDQEINHVWSFMVDEHLLKEQGYLQYTQSTFARFQCSHCSRWWNSAKVHILFLIRWDRTYRRGTVKMRIFKQKCRRCYSSVLENPEITKENVNRVISNLVSKIQSMVYGQKNTRPPLSPVIYSDDLEGPHEKEHCEACKMQVCPWNAEHQEKTAKPQPVNFHRWTNPGIQEQNKTIAWTSNNCAPYHLTTTVHQDENNEVSFFVLIIILIVAFLIIITKQ